MMIDIDATLRREQPPELKETAEQYRQRREYEERGKTVTIHTSSVEVLEECRSYVGFPRMMLEIQKSLRHSLVDHLHEKGFITYINRPGEVHCSIAVAGETDITKTFLLRDVWKDGEIRRLMRIVSDQEKELAEIKDRFTSKLADEILRTLDKVAVMKEQEEEEVVCKHCDRTAN